MVLLDVPKNATLFVNRDQAEMLRRDNPGLLICPHYQVKKGEMWVVHVDGNSYKRPLVWNRDTGGGGAVGEDGVCPGATHTSNQGGNEDTGTGKD